MWVPKRPPVVKPSGETLYPSSPLISPLFSPLKQKYFYFFVGLFLFIFEMKVCFVAKARRTSWAKDFPSACLATSPPQVHRAVPGSKLLLSADIRFMYHFPLVSWTFGSEVKTHENLLFLFH